MIRQKVMLTIMSVCLVNINISAAELLPEESTSSVEISFEEEIEETESDLKLEDSVTTEVVLDQYYEERSCFPPHLPIQHKKSKHVRRCHEIVERFPCRPYKVHLHQCTRKCQNRVQNAEW